MQEEIFSTTSASIRQCEHSDTFVLSYDQDMITFKLCDLFTLKRKVMNIDIIELLESTAPDVEIIHLPHCDRFLVLNLEQILQFRELLNGTFDILALNSSIQRILRKNVFNF